MPQRHQASKESIPKARWQNPDSATLLPSGEGTYQLGGRTVR